MVDKETSLGADKAGTSAERTVVLFDAEYDDLRPAVSFIFKRFPLPLRGARVLVKPNMLGPYPPEKAVTTHPALIEAVVEYLLDAGANPQVGDNPGARGYGISRSCGKITGIEAASRGCYINLGSHPAEVSIDSSRTAKLRVSGGIFEADLIVSLPKLKTHVQTIMTGGLKNTFGYLIGAEKSRIHSLARSSKDFASLLVDVYSIRPPDLTIMDAVWAMEGDGPSSGRPRHVGKIIASTDALAVDAVASMLIGLDPERILYFKEAQRRWPNGGRFDSVGPAKLVPIQDFSLPTSFIYDMQSYLANWLVFSFLKKNRLRIRKDLCTKCGECAQSCPVGAIDLKSGFPEIDRKECIVCYCCHELCSTGAIELNPYLRTILRGRRC